MLRRRREKRKKVTRYKRRIGQIRNKEEIKKTREAGSEAIKIVSNNVGAISNNTQVIYIICIYKYKYYKGY